MSVRVDAFCALGHHWKVDAEHVSIDKSLSVKAKIDRSDWNCPTCHRGATQMDLSVGGTLKVDLPTTW